MILLLLRKKKKKIKKSNFNYFFCIKKREWLLNMFGLNEFIIIMEI